MKMDVPTAPPSMSNDDTMNMGAKMHTSFYWGRDAIILFSGWPKDSLGMYFLAFFFVLLLAVAVEILDRPAAKPSSSVISAGFAQAGVHALRMTLAYLVMLAVMSFNLGVFIAAVAGHAIGFFVIRNRALASAKPTETTGV